VRTPDAGRPSVDAERRTSAPGRRLPAARCQGRTIESIESIKAHTLASLQSIREAAKRNDTKSMRVLAKEVVRSRQAVVRMLESRGALHALDLQMSESLRNYRLSKTVESSGQMMKEMNKLMRIDRYKETIQAMQREMFTAGMLSGEVNEGMDGLVDTEDVEEETEEKVQEVLDQICGETLAQAADATVPTSRVEGGKEAVDELEDDRELMRALAAGEI
jgi:charged multivesicular body protein 3